MRRTIPIIVMVTCIVLGSTIDAGPITPQRDAAADLLRIMGLERTMMAGMTTMVDIQIQQNPTLGPYRDVLLKWAETFMTWDAVSPELIDLYAGTFTESELQELIAFYKTPTGQKALTEIPGLMQKGAAIGTDIAKKHTAELEKMIRERAKEIEKATQKPEAGGA